MNENFLFQVEFKANEEEKGVIEGWASTYGNIDRTGDIIAPGAFKSANGKKFPVFGMHDPSKGIGVGTFTEVDEKGLYVKIKLAVDNADSDILRERAKEYYAMAKEGIISDLSVGFQTLEQDFESRKVDGKDRTLRIIKTASLLEVSLVPIPANPKARMVSVKSITDDELQELISKAVEPYQKQVDDLKTEIEALKKTEQNQKQVKKAFSLDQLIARRLRL